MARGQRTGTSLSWAWALLALAGMSSMVGRCWAQAQELTAPQTIFMRERLVAHLDSLADTATIEHFRCLIGSHSPLTVSVAQLYAPPIAHADYNTVTPAVRCPLGTVGEWHNHIPYTVPINDPHNRATRVEPWSVCEMSPGDRLSAAETPPTTLVMMISVGAGVHCAWLRWSATDWRRLPWIAP